MQESKIKAEPEENEDESLRDKVIAKLTQEPQIGASEIGVTASERVITLSGYADTETEKQLAETIAMQVSGVRGLANELEIKPFTILTDTDLAKTVLHALESEHALDAKGISIVVDDGWLTLEGEVAEEKQKLNAEKTVRDLSGIRGVTNQILVKK